MLTKNIQIWLDHTDHKNLITDGAEFDLLFSAVCQLIRKSKDQNGKPDATRWDILKQCFSKYSEKYRLHYNKLNVAYSSVIKFGTAGVRNTLINGLGGINATNIIRLTTALVKYYQTKFPSARLQKSKILVIGDSRMQSNQFVHLAAAILTHNQIHTVIAPFNLPTPTPFASYATKNYGYLGAIVITASHNNYCDNGYKVYNEHGQQLVSADTNLISKFFAAECEQDVNCDTKPINSDYLSFVPERDYFNYGSKFVKIIAEKFKLKLCKEPRETVVTYSSQFGASHMFLPKALRDLGYHVNLVKNQSFFDNRFHGLEFTMNPENINAYQESIKQASRSQSDIILHTDCDGDRIGVCLYSRKRQQWEYVHTTHLATLILLYLNEVDPNSLVNKHFVSSYVSGSLITAIAKKFKMIVHETPTGPKNLVDAMCNKCQNNCLFAFEQSNGFILSEKIPDKDGLTAAVMITSMLEYFCLQGLDYDKLITKLGEQFGYLAFHEGAEWLTALHTDELVTKIFTAVATKNVPEFSQIGKYEIKDFNESNTPDSKSNFYQVQFSTHNWITLRLSNTERKLKFYVHCVTNSYEESEKRAKVLMQAAHQFAKRFLD